ncbi:hypothetical protein MAR_005759 [Mya arenaria]|uniref:Uncharacterized protein n=1 Tax=Mya arenaria TaxID=6604 RepID=A0ABY7F377_MYAAR|nr:hypothetical protein MAR_005759 [Mya arenaria]
MGGNSAESLLYQHCHAPSFDFQTWQIDLQVAMQDCFSGVDVKDVAATYLNPDYFYTFKWP